MRDDHIEIPFPPPNDRPGDRVLPNDDPDGQPDQEVCLSWTGKRRKLIAGFIAVLTACGAIVLCLYPNAVLFKPGPLSKSHAQILAGTVLEQRCATCHTQSSLSPLAMVSFVGDPHQKLSQTKLCLDCHQKKITPNLATAAHNLPLSVRDELTSAIHQSSTTNPSHSFWNPPAAVDQNAIQCAACHKEHHGAMVDLTAMTSAQCQSCHVQRFDRFAGSHPDWGSWPYGRGGEIAFDHRTHMAKHFPNDGQEGRTFDCSKCHNSSDASRIAKGELSRSTSYESSCAACHDESMRVQLSNDIELAALPMIPESIAESLPAWPKESIGFIDGRISPLLELLIRGDEKLARLLRRIPEGDLGRLSESDPETLDLVRAVAEEISILFDEITLEGHTAIEKRLARSGITTGSLGPLLRSLPPQMIESTRQKWELSKPQTLNPQASMFPSAIRLVLADDEDLLATEPTNDSLLELSPIATPNESDDDDLLTPSDPLSEMPLFGSPHSETPLKTNRQSVPSQLIVNQGGWYRDDLVFAIRYRASQHADEVLVSLIELFAQLSHSDPLKKRFFQKPAVAACVSCHSTADAFPAAWKANPMTNRRIEFTKFSHRPHLNVSALGDCQHCHQVNVNSVIFEAASGQRPNAGTNQMHTVNEFLPLKRQTCVGCHTKSAAGDACTQCHRYHIDW